MIINTKEINNGAKSRVQCKCKKCGYEWETSAQKLIYQQTGCGRCHGAVQMDNDYFIDRLRNENPNIEPLEKYVNDRTKILCKCKKCGNEWKVSPTKLHQGRNCPKCSSDNRIMVLSKSHEDFIKEMKKVNPTIMIQGQYINGKTKVDCQCKICNQTWKATPNNLLRFRGCPYCKISEGEKRIMLFLNNHKIKYHHEHTFGNCKDKRELRFDFYIAKLNTVIEFDGIQHFYPYSFTYGKTDKSTMIKNLDDCQRRDNIKNKYCEENNIKMIRIPYWDYKNIEEILTKQILQT